MCLAETEIDDLNAFVGVRELEVAKDTRASGD